MCNVGEFEICVDNHLDSDGDDDDGVGTLDPCASSKSEDWLAKQES